MSDFPFDTHVEKDGESGLPDDVRIISVGARAQFEAKIDGVDYSAVIENRWTYKRSQWKYGANIYARRHLRRAGQRVTLYLHRFILESLMGIAPPSDLHQVDHINGDTLDNRRENLRWATRSQQTKNQRGKRS